MSEIAGEVPIRVDSVGEEYAYVAANPPLTGAWEIVSQTIGRTEIGTRDVLLARDPAGTEQVFRFDVASFFGTTGVLRLNEPTTVFLETVMERADAFAKGNGAHHPGSLPRFPMPSDRYPGRLDVPMPVLAVDAGKRGLYGPVRVVTMGYEEAEPFGVGDFPGFDPNDWPPRRLGDWPPSGAAGFDRVRLQATISRFNAVGVRLYDAFIHHRGYPQTALERQEFLTLLHILDLAQMNAPYRRISGRFIAWLERSQD